MDKIWLHFDGKNGFEYNFKLQVKSKIYNIIIKYCPVCILGGYLLPFSDRSNQTSLNAPNSKRYKHYRTLRMSLLFKSLSRYVKTNLINFIKENLFVWLVPSSWLSIGIIFITVFLTIMTVPFIYTKLKVLTLFWKKNSSVNNESTSMKKTC